MLFNAAIICYADNLLLIVLFVFIIFFSLFLRFTDEKIGLLSSSSAVFFFLAAVLCWLWKSRAISRRIQMTCLPVWNLMCIYERTREKWKQTRINRG